MDGDVDGKTCEIQAEKEYLKEQYKESAEKYDVSINMLSHGNNVMDGSETRGPPLKKVCTQTREVT